MRRFQLRGARTRLWGPLAAAFLAVACAVPERNPARDTAPAPGTPWRPAPTDAVEPVATQFVSELPAALVLDRERLTLAQLIGAALRANPTTRQKWQKRAPPPRPGPRLEGPTTRLCRGS